MKLRINEEFFIQALRIFTFLRRLGYNGESFLIFERETGFTLTSVKYKRRISVNWFDWAAIDVTFEKVKWTAFKKDSFRLSEYYNAFGYPHLKERITLSIEEDREKLVTLLKGNADLIQEHLMPIVKGEKWISDYNGLKT